MKNTIKLLGIIALVAVIGFSFSACGNNNNGGGGGGNGGGGGGGGSKLTITGLPSGAIYDVLVLPAGVDLSDPDALDEVVAISMPSAGNVFTFIDPIASAQANSAVYWSGSGNWKIILKESVAVWHATVNFSNGSATVPFSNFTEFTN